MLPTSDSLILPLCDFTKVSLTVSSSSTSFSEDKSYKHFYKPANMKDGEVYEVVFDLEKCDKWTGYITKIRIDPFNLKENCNIDYIRFVK